MAFTKNSGLVKIWATRVRNGVSTLDQVPAIFNLKDVVKEIVEADK